MRVGFMVISWHTGSEYKSLDVSDLLSRTEKGERGRETASGSYKALKVKFYPTDNGSENWSKQNPLEEVELKTLEDVLKLLQTWDSNNTGPLRIFNEYLETLPTKLAKHQSTKALTKEIGFSENIKDMKDLIVHYLTVGANQLFTSDQDGKTTYFIGDDLGSILDLNKTSYNFAKYLIEKGYSRSRELNYEDYKKSQNEEPLWYKMLRESKLSKVLLKQDNFGDYNSLVDYIEGVKLKPNSYNHIFAVYNTQTGTLDVYDQVEHFKTMKEYRVIKNVTMLFFNLFRHKGIKSVPRDTALQMIDSQFQEVVKSISY